MRYTQPFKVRKTAPVKKIRRFWLGLVLAVPLVLFWVRQTVLSTQMLYEIQKIEQEIKKERNRRADLEMKKDRILSLEALEERAKMKLGLVVPGKENIVLMVLGPLSKSK